jgi:hypothetical protein
MIISTVASNLDDAGPVIREIVGPIPVGLRRILVREGDLANGIFFRLRKFLQPFWLVPARPQPGAVPADIENWLWRNCRDLVSRRAGCACEQVGVSPVRTSVFCSSCCG